MLNVLFNNNRRNIPKETQELVNKNKTKEYIMYIMYYI